MRQIQMTDEQYTYLTWLLEQDGVQQIANKLDRTGFEYDHILTPIYELFHKKARGDRKTHLTRLFKITFFDVMMKPRYLWAKDRKSIYVQCKELGYTESFDVEEVPVPKRHLYEVI